MKNDQHNLYTVYDIKFLGNRNNFTCLWLTQTNAFFSVKVPNNIIF